MKQDALGLTFAQQEEIDRSNDARRRARSDLRIYGDPNFNFNPTFTAVTASNASMVAELSLQAHLRSAWHVVRNRPANPIYKLFGGHCMMPG
jgi:hypothetical protein